ncbi:MAG: ribonuclease HII [Eubacterium sp.]|nr:ribonuclease HII [Eubacterium sp.]
MTKKEEAEQKRRARLKKEQERVEELCHFEKLYWKEYPYIAGIDEVGRGPFAGPVMTAAVILPPDCRIMHINDSKKLSPKRREELYLEIKEKALAIGIGRVEPDEIDCINILQATYKAMREAVSKLEIPPDMLLIDAVHIPELDIKQVSIVKGDAKSQSIAAASIIAKVTRDHIMEEYDKIYPGYEFAANKGYGTAAHIRALKDMGPCPIHRKSFIHNYVNTL